PRTETEEPVVFLTNRELQIPPRTLQSVFTQATEAEPVDHGEDLRSTDRFEVFTSTPSPGDALLLGLNDAAASCIVVLRFDSQVQGVGVDPRYPPLAWEAWTGSSWRACDVDSDGTGGLNRSGDVVLHLPHDHRT